MTDFAFAPRVASRSANAPRLKALQLGLLWLVGASGAISAIMATYALLYSQQTVRSIGPISANIVRLLWLAAAWILLALVIAALFLTQAFQESALRRLGNVLNETVDEIVVAAARTPRDQAVPQIQDARTLRLLSGKYWAIAREGPDGRLVMLERSRSLWNSDLDTPPDLPERLDAAFGDVISFNTVGPKGEPLRAAASMKSIPRYDEPVVFLAALDRSNIDADTRQFATVTWIALLVMGFGLV